MSKNNKIEVMPGFNVIWDSYFNRIVYCDKTEEYLNKEKNIVPSILDKQDEFFNRAKNTISLDGAKSFRKIMELYFNNKEFVWYYGMIIEASLECMELMKSLRYDTEYVDFSSIWGIIDPKDGNLFFEEKLTEKQMECVVLIISRCHPLGIKFSNYVECKKRTR